MGYSSFANYEEEWWPLLDLSLSLSGVTVYTCQYLSEENKKWLAKIRGLHTSSTAMNLTTRFRLPLKIVVSIPDVYLNICFSFDFAGCGATILLSNPDQRLASVGF